MLRDHARLPMGPVVTVPPTDSVSFLVPWKETRMKQIAPVLVPLLSGILALCGCDTGDPATFPLSQPPGVPSNIAPANNATDVPLPIILSWISSTGATRYALQVSTSDSFTSFVYNESSLTTTSQRVAGLMHETPYSWRVRASNMHGTSEWTTPPWHFRTAGIEACPGTPTVSWAGKTYNTVQLGTQCWLRENLDVGIMVADSQDQTNNGTIEKYCYNNSHAHCVTYGGLYQWEETLQYDTTQGGRGICPPGWHIPTLAELQTLSDTVGGDGTALKAVGEGTGGGSGTNASGFSALLAGSRDVNGGFLYFDTYGSFWSSTQVNLTHAQALNLHSGDAVILLGGYYKPLGFSVRCIKD